MQLLYQDSGSLDGVLRALSFVGRLRDARGLLDTLETTRLGDREKVGALASHYHAASNTSFFLLILNLLIYVIYLNIY